MNQEFIEALDELEKEKGISKEVVFSALEAAMVSSYKKNFGTSQNVEVNIDRETGKIDIYALQDIVADEDLIDDKTQLSISQAKKLDTKYEVGDVFSKMVDPAKFGRIAAQTAKQVVIQRIKDAERDIIFDDFTDRENEIITGQVQRVSYGNVFFDLGKTEAILLPSEQIKGETYKQGARFKLLLVEVKKTTKGPQIILSRSHPNLVKRLFELEVPEIAEGIVEVYSIAREAGSRTKIAVFSKDEEVDPLGACVGYKGARVKAIVDELHDEKVDIVIYSKDIDTFIANALSPSKVEKVFINEKEKSALVVVPDYQLSLAIGKEGQNARLAAKLTGWKIDIKSTTQYEQYLEIENITEEDLYERYGCKSDFSEETIENHDDSVEISNEITREIEKDEN